MVYFFSAEEGGIFYKVYDSESDTVREAIDTFKELGKPFILIFENGTRYDSFVEDEDKKEIVKEEVKLQYQELLQIDFLEKLYI